MKGILTIFTCSALVLINSLCSASVTMPENFESMTPGDTFGEIYNLYDLSNNQIPIAGGTIVEHSGNNMVSLQGISPNWTADLGFALDNSQQIEGVRFDFFFNYNSVEQAQLFVPTTVQADLYLLNGNKLMDQINIFNINPEGLQSSSIHPAIVYDQISYPANYSLTDLAHFYADFSNLSVDFTSYDSVLLVFTMLYAEEGFDKNIGEPYNSIFTLDNVGPVPEPAAWASFVFGLIGFMRFRKKFSSR